ncbi:MAG: cryptochrome/photolyase family protein [Bacteroidetes bacterium]|nr:cryptochrome/photolyase family protein [Bacteroidota bacterium]
MTKIGLFFPHQLFEDHPIFSICDHLYLVEESLFFKYYAFHKQKLAFHRATMKSLERKLVAKNIAVSYISCFESIADIRQLLPYLAQKHSMQELHFIDPTDDWLSQRIGKTSKSLECKLIEYENPLFLNTRDDLKSFFRSKKQSFFQTTFYKQQRKRFNILIDQDGHPAGGKWSYDTENRKKYPKVKKPPKIDFPEPSSTWDEAVQYVDKHFRDNPGKIEPHPIYPISHETSKQWFQQFLDSRFHDFGAYEDAIVMDESILNHSLISPLLNIGLLNPKDIIDQAITFSKEQGVPINSTEGFIRQVIGWREFMRGMYESKGRSSRTRNFWNFKRKIPANFYDGTTGIDPIDQTIHKVLHTGYCHHIERLMVLGNFMLLCEFDPDEVYQWFMELFIDAYDWVMVPNVYGMSQFADGGLFATKPYISSSNYLMKMSDYPDGEWQKTWDGLFWAFIHNHQDFFEKNPRTKMLLYSYNRMSDEKRKIHLGFAKEFLSSLKSD